MVVRVADSHSIEAASAIGHASAPSHTALGEKLCATVRQAIAKHLLDGGAEVPNLRQLAPTQPPVVVGGP